MFVSSSDYTPVLDSTVSLEYAIGETPLLTQMVVATLAILCTVGLICTVKVLSGRCRHVPSSAQQTFAKHPTRAQERVANLERLITLVNNNQAYPEATVAAGRAIKSSSSWLRFYGKNLYLTLIRQGQSYPEAIAAAKQCIRQGEWDNAFLIFSTLVEKRQAYPEAFAAVMQAISRDIQELGNVLDVMAHLVRQGYEPAYEPTIQLIIPQIPDLTPHSAWLTPVAACCQALIDQGQTEIYPHALMLCEAFARYLSDQALVWRIFTALVRQEYEPAYARALFLAIPANNTPYPTERRTLCTALVCQKPVLSRLLTMAAENSASPDPKKRIFALDLFSTFAFAQAQAINAKAWTVATKNLHDTNPSVREAAVRVLCAFVREGISLPEIEALLDTETVADLTPLRHELHYRHALSRINVPCKPDHKSQESEAPPRRVPLPDDVISLVARFLQRPL